MINKMKQVIKLLLVSSILILLNVGILKGQNMNNKTYINKEILLEDSLNKKFFPLGKEITQLLIDAVKSKKIIPYEDFLMKKNYQ